MIHSILAVLGGFATMAVLVMIGWVTVRIAGTQRHEHTLALAGFVLFMSLMTMLQSRKRATGQPSWYLGMIAVIGVCGVLIGGMHVPQ